MTHIDKFYAERLDTAIRAAADRNIAHGRISLFNEDTGEVSNIAQCLARSLVTELLKRDADETLSAIRRALEQARSDLQWVHDQIPGSDFSASLQLIEAVQTNVKKRIEHYEQNQTRI